MRQRALFGVTLLILCGLLTAGCVTSFFWLAIGPMPDPLSPITAALIFGTILGPIFGPLTVLAS